MNGGTGRCLCGAVRFAFQGEPNWQAHCHCESCRRNCAAPFTSYFGVDHGKWSWTAATPAIFASSPGVRRHFCATCGTPMAYESDRFAHELHFYAATLDDPDSYRPTVHVHWDEHLPWIRLADGLPVSRHPRRLMPDEDTTALLGLIRGAFAYMDGVVDPPSSMHRLTAETVMQQARDGEIWVLEECGAAIACIFLSFEPDQIYAGKLAVAEQFRGQGLGRQLIDLAERRARERGLDRIVVQSRVELTGNHAGFRAMGFQKIGETAHEGYDRPTSFVFARPVRTPED